MNASELVQIYNQQLLAKPVVWRVADVLWAKFWMTPMNVFRSLCARVRIKDLLLSQAIKKCVPEPNI